MNSNQIYEVVQQSIRNGHRTAIALHANINKDANIYI